LYWILARREGVVTVVAADAASAVVVVLISVLVVVLAATLVVVLVSLLVGVLASALVIVLASALAVVLILSLHAVLVMASRVAIELSHLDILYIVFRRPAGFCSALAAPVTLFRQVATPGLAGINGRCRWKLDLAGGLDGLVRSRLAELGCS